MASTTGSRHAVIVGGGFAGRACVRDVADREDVAVTLLDRSADHQFRPLLSHVASSQVAPSDAEEWAGDALVVADGSQSQISGTHGASARPSDYPRPDLRIPMERL